MTLALSTLNFVFLLAARVVQIIFHLHCSLSIRIASARQPLEVAVSVFLKNNKIGLFFLNVLWQTLFAVCFNICQERCYKAETRRKTRKLPLSRSKRQERGDAAILVFSLFRLLILTIYFTFLCPIK